MWFFHRLISPRPPPSLLQARSTLLYASHLPHSLLTRERLADPLLSPFPSHTLANWYSSFTSWLTCHLYPQHLPPQSPVTFYP